MKRSLGAVGAVIVGVLLLGIAAIPLLANSLTTVVDFDPSAGELPEGLAVDRKGNLFVGMAPTGEIKEVRREGEVSTFANLPNPAPGFMTGMAFDRGGKLYVASASFNADTHGIWRVRKNGTLELFASLNPGGLPNVLAFDKRQNLFVSDSILGLIWKIDKHGTVSVWKADPLLRGIGGGPFGFTIGANGLSFDEDEENLYVANTEKGLIARIEVRSNGTAGNVYLFVEHPSLVGADGMTFDDEENLYVAVNSQDSIVVVSADGDVHTLAQGGLLQNPAEVRFGAKDSEDTLYITNFAISRALGLVLEDPMPSLLSLQVADDD